VPFVHLSNSLEGVLRQARPSVLVAAMLLRLLLVFRKNRKLYNPSILTLDIGGNHSDARPPIPDTAPLLRFRCLQKFITADVLAWNERDELWAHPSSTALLLGDRTSPHLWGLELFHSGESKHPDVGLLGRFVLVP
jgi:hypothetical protein